MISHNNILSTIVGFCIFFFCIFPVRAAETITHEAFLPQNIIVKFKASNAPSEIQQRIKTSTSFSLQGVWEKAVALMNTNIRKKTADQTLLQQFTQLKTATSFTYSPLFISSNKDFSPYYLIKTKNYYTFSKTLPLLSKLEIVEYALPDSQVVIQKTNLGIEVNTNVPLPTAPDAAHTPTKIKKSAAGIAKKNKGMLAVAVLDTGIETKSTRLSAYITPGFNVLDNTRNIQDKNGHGTEISTTIASHLKPGQAQLLPIKNFDSTGITTLSKVVQGLYQVYTLSQSLNIRIVNLSFAGPRLTRVGNQTYDSCKLYYDVAKKFSNTLFVAAAGNDNTNTTPAREYDGVAPAGCTSFISVGAETKKGDKENFSNKSGSDIYASGEGVTIQGTSVATAHISGTLAELLSNKPLLSSTQIIELLNKNKWKNSAAVGQLSLNTFIEEAKKLPNPTPTHTPNIGGTNIMNVIQSLTATQSPTSHPTNPPNTPTLTHSPLPSVTNTPPTLTTIPSTQPTPTVILPTDGPTNPPVPTNPLIPPTATPRPQPTNTLPPPAPPAPTNTSSPPTSIPIQCFETFELCDNTCRGGKCEYSDVLCDPRNMKMFACH